MRSNSRLARCLVAAALGLGGMSADALAQVPGPATAARPAAYASAETLEKLVAPVALYPDELLAVVLQAATQPVQVVQAGRFLERYAKDKSLQPSATWSEPVKILVNYPEVLKKLNDDLDWTEQLGIAVRAQQGDVMAAVQRFRRRAAAAGNLRSDDRLTVVQDGANYVIESAVPQQIPVPVYDPRIVIVQQPAPPPPVYVTTPYPAYYDPYPAYAAAATGFFFGALTTAWVMDWNRYDIDEDDIRDFQQSRQQSRQDATAQRQQTRQSSTAQRQQTRQDALQQPAPTPPPRPAPAGQQDLGAILGGERPAQRPGQGGAPAPAQRPVQGAAQQPQRNLDNVPRDRPSQMPAGGAQVPAQRPVQGVSQPTQRPAYDSGVRDRPGQMPAGGGAYTGQRPSAGAGTFDYGSGRSVTQASDWGAQSRSLGGGRTGGGGGGGGRGGRR